MTKRNRNKPCRVEQLLEHKRTMAPSPRFRIGETVLCGIHDRRGSVLDIKGGRLKNVTDDSGNDVEILEPTTTRRARDEYGVYLVEFRSAGGSTSQSYWLEAEMKREFEGAQA